MADTSVFICQRYDRKFNPEKNEIERIHQEDFCQALGIMNEIKYTQENIELFKQFLNSSDNLKSYFNEYKDNIKGFLNNECGIWINVYFQRLNYRLRYFFIIETNYEFYTSDDIEMNIMKTYNEALNKAINFIFTNVLNVVKV